MPDHTSTGEFVTPATNVADTAQLTVAIKDMSLPGRTGPNEFVLQASSGALRCVIPVGDFVAALKSGTISESRTDLYGGAVASSHTALDPTISVMLDPAADYSPTAHHVIGVADDHDDTNILYGEIASIDDTDAPVYVLTLENVLANAYCIGAPVIFYAGIPPATGYDRIKEGILTQLSKPALLSATWATATLTVAAITDKAVLYNGCVAIWVSDTPFTPRNVSRIDGIYPDEIVEGSEFVGEKAVTGFTTMNGGAAIGTGTRYFLPLGIPNKTAAECANTSAGTGMFGAIFGAMPTADISGSVS